MTKPQDQFTGHLWNHMNSQWRLLRRNSAISHPAQLFRVTWSLTERVQNINNQTISCELFASFSADKILSLRHDLHQILIHYVGLRPLGCPCILDAVRPTTCLLAPCHSWLLKAGVERIQGPLVNLINLFFETGIFLGGLKGAVVMPLLKKPTLDPSD